MGMAVHTVRQYCGFAHPETPHGCGSSGFQRETSQTLDEHTGFAQDTRVLMIVDIRETFYLHLDRHAGLSLHKGEAA